MYQPSKDMKSLSFFSIYKESFNIISSNQKLFTQIAIFLALPYYIITAIHTPLSSFLFPNTSIVDHQSAGTSNSNPPTISLWTNPTFLAFNLLYTVLSLGLSLLSFSSVTYSVACIYTEHNNITFKTTLHAFNKAWKRLVLTVLAELLVMFGLFLLLAGLYLLGASFYWAVSSGHYQLIALLAAIILLVIIAGVVRVVYLSFVWVFARTVANLETSYGFKALSKSKSLIKGKRWLIFLVILPISLCSSFVAWVFLKVVINGGLIDLGFVSRISCGVVCLILMVALLVFGVVVLTVCYLVCKADKEERITKSDVMDHLDIFVDGYSPILKDDEKI